MPIKDLIDTLEDTLTTPIISRELLVEYPELTTMIPDSYIFNLKEILFDTLPEEIQLKISIYLFRVEKIIYDKYKDGTNIKVYEIDLKTSDVYLKLKEIHSGEVSLDNIINNQVDFSSEDLIQLFVDYCIEQDRFLMPQRETVDRPAQYTSVNLDQNGSFIRPQLEIKNFIAKSIEVFYKTSRGSMPFDATFGTILKQYLHTRDVGKIRAVALNEAQGLLKSCGEYLQQFDLDLKVIDIEVKETPFKVTLDLIYSINGAIMETTIGEV